MTPTIEERRAALALPVWTPRTLDAHLACAAARYGDRPLVITDARTLSYAEVDAWATRLAEGLVALGVRPGDRVGLSLANVLEFAPVKFAIARAGATAIPFNFLYRTDELAYVLRQSRASALIAMTGFAGLDVGAMLRGIDAPELRLVVRYDTGEGLADPALPTLDDVVAAGTPGAAPGGGDPAGIGDILYTSGTTGSPKGVMVTHDAVVRTGYGSALTRAMEDGRRILFSLPCFHMFGYVEGLVAATHVGGAVIPRTTFTPADHLASVERHRATDLLCVPTMGVALLEHPDRHTRDTSSLFALLSGAAPGPAWLWEQARRDLGVTEVTTGYGMTECGGAMTLTLPEDPVERHVGTVGRPKLAGAAGLAGGALCEYATVDPLTGSPQPPGTEGELVSRGPTHMPGFFDKPEETATALRDGWLHSGDLGIVQADGYLRVTGRTKELYKSGGELVMPKEVEALLAGHPGVSQAYVVGVPDERWGEIGVAYVVAEPGATLDVPDLDALCRGSLARFKVPKRIVVVGADELPLTATGKVQKFRLVERALEALI